jgi:Ran GTPase-activating protein (RanGAP) involved in mRNA processing and transport
MGMNMSYCRMENTLMALQECFDADMIGNNTDDMEAAIDLYRLCCEIANTYDMGDLESKLQEMQDEENEEEEDDE